MADPTKYYVRVKRLSIQSDCSLCATPITTGVKASLRYPRRGDVKPWLYLCDDCAEIIGEHAWTPGAPMVDRRVGGMCCVIPVDAGCIACGGAPELPPASDLDPRVRP